MAEKGFKSSGKFTIPAKIVEGALNIMGAKKGLPAVNCGESPIEFEGTFETSDSLVEFGQFLLAVAREGRKYHKEDLHERYIVVHEEENQEASRNNGVLRNAMKREAARAADSQHIKVEDIND